MVAKTPPKQKRMVASAAAATLNPIQVRETLKKVEMCMNRLQELQFTVTGGNKVISGVSLSPRSTRTYLKTSLRCKQESVRIKNGGGRKSPVGKFPANAGGEWKRMSLPAMLVGETIGEILTASKFAREMVEAVTNNTNKNTSMDDPKTPLTTRQRNRKPNIEDSELRARRKREKQEKFQSKRTESHSPSLQRVRSRINFKVVSPPTKRDVVDKENARYMANRVSPRNRPWTKKTILFPNPLFLSTDNSSQQPKFCRTKSPVITKTRQQTPHKFLIKSPVSASKFQVKIKSPPVVITRSPTRPVVITLSPTRQVSLNKQSPKRSAASKLRRSFSPSRLVASKLRQPFSPARLTASKLRQSFSPSRLAARLVSPLKSRKSVQKYDGNINLSGLKQRPINIQMRI
ncbi:microtubule-binding protein TANGLED [Benincasa hispida]|uniref:microtubule-binding protein TANGLED n=1 Tax=Benincasa hispida TaxID=102211 RepID=UPI0019018076|nr:microtubule-binding protein TANGLED [Benincasa hispida]